MSNVLVFDPERENEVNEIIIPLLGDLLSEAQPFPADMGKESIITYLGDDALSRLLIKVAGSQNTISFLPHPDMIYAREYFGVATDLKDAFEDIKSGDRTEADLLFCNNQLVFQAVVVGDPFTLTDNQKESNWFSKVKRTALLMFHSSASRLLPFTLVTAKKKEIKTAALGIILVAHGRNPLFPPEILTESYAGLSQAIILCPRSMGELIIFLLKSLFHQVNGGVKLPPFVSYIQSKSVQIQAEKEFDFTIDGKPVKADKLHVRIEAKAISIIPGSDMRQYERAAEDKESYKIEGLPTGETVQELVKKNMPLLRRASTEDFRDLFVMLRENASVTESYFVLMLLSGLLATLGLISNSGTVIIGAMILAPLMGPFTTLSMGLLRQDEKLVAQSLKTVLVGVILTLISGAVIGSLLPLHSFTSEMNSRVSPNLLDLGIAVVAGIAGAYAHARERLVTSIAAVAIAAALVPPLSVAGIGVGWGSKEIFSGSLLLFVTNAAGILLAGGITFLLLGYSPFHRAKKGLILSLLLALLVSVPLMMGFFRVIEKQRVINALDGWGTRGVILEEIEILLGEPLRISARILTREPLDGNDISHIKQDIEEEIGEPVYLEASVVIFR